MLNLSKSPVLNAVYNDIWEYLEDLGMPELIHYMTSFPNEPDFNLVNYGEMRIYYAEIRDMYVNAGNKKCAETYKKSRNGHMYGDPKIDDFELWEKYRRDVGYVAKIYARQ